MRLLTYIVLFFASAHVWADPTAQQNPWQSGMANSNMQSQALMNMAKDEEDSSMKYMLMMMAIQQQAQASAYKSSQEKSQPDKKKETDDKAQNQLAMPSALPSPSMDPAKPEETLIYQDNIKAINEKITSESKKEVTSNIPLPEPTFYNVDMNLIRDVASIPEEVPVVRNVGTFVPSAIPESARTQESQTVSLASVSSPLENLMGPLGVASVDGRGANSTTVNDLSKISTAIEQTVNPPPAKKASAVYDEAEATSGTKSEKSGSSFQSMMEMLMGEMNSERPAGDEQMGVEFGEYRTGSKRVPNIFQVAQFLYQVSAEEKRLRKPASKK